MQIHKDEILVVEEKKGVHVVHFVGDALMDPKDVEHVDTRLDELLRFKGRAKLVISLDEVEKLSSLMLSALLKLRTQIHARGGQVCLAAVPPALQSLFELVRVSDVFDTYETVDEAIAALNA